jgi:sodium/potassium-transporting ATPase subunit alpha
MICSEAKFDATPDQIATPGFKYATCPVIGDASETALIKFYQPIEEITITRARYGPAFCADKSFAKMPFNSTNKYALSIVEQPTSDSDYCVYIKGAPEKIWKFCTRILYEGRFKNIDKEENDKFAAINLRFGKNGERVLGFAKLHLNKEKYPKGYAFNTSNPDNFNFPVEGFVFVGLLSLMDPPK